MDVNGNFTADSVVTVVNGGVDKINSFGIIGDTALVGDWNGDGIDEIGAYRGSSGTFFLDASGDGYWDSVSTGDISFTFGPSGVAPVVGAWADPAMNFGPRHMLLPQNSTSDTVYFMVSDPDDPVSSLSVSGVADDTTIVTSISITTGTGAVREATVTSGSVPGTTKVTLTVTDPSQLTDDDWFDVTVEPPPEVSIIASDPTAIESPLDTGTFTISRSGSDILALPVNFTIDGSATHNVDYNIDTDEGLALSSSGVLEIPAGRSSIDVIVTPIDDLHFEPTEDIIMELQEIAGSYTVGQESALVSLLDNGDTDPNTNLRIFDGQFGKEVAEGKEESRGAFTVANMNDTDHDQVVDSADANGVVSVDGHGRDEV